jgi:ribosome-binding factor A
MAESIRLRRIESTIRQEIGMMILQGFIKDPRVSEALTITRVVVSKDIGYAKVYVSSLSGEASLESGVNALNHAAGFIQVRIGKQLKTKNTPRLRFFGDHSIEDGVEMTRKLEELDL